MLPSSSRIPKSLFKDAMRRGSSFQSRSFRALFFIDDTNRTSRFAVVVSKKIARNAVLRNRTRRQVYALLRGYCKMFPGLRAAFFMRAVPAHGLTALKNDLDEFFNKKARFR